MGSRVDGGSRRRFLISLFVVALLVAGSITGALLWWPERGHAAHSASTAPAAVPVSIVEAKRRDIPVYLDGLGAVVASSTVSIRSQVDGKLAHVDFVEGQEVRKGDLLAQIDPRPFQAALDQVKAKKAQDEAQLASAQLDLQRIRNLVAKSFETQQDLDHQIALVDQTKAAIAADQAAIEAAQVQLDDTKITAPVEGRTGIRQIDAGNIVHASDTTPIVILTRTRPIAVIFSLPETDLDGVRKAMQTKSLEVLAYDQDNRNLLAKGRLELIDNIVDQATSTIRLKARFANADGALWPGEFVNARLLLEVRHDNLTIPTVAVQRGPEGLFAWVVGNNGRANMRRVTIGPSYGGSTVVTGGLSDGERVVVAGQSKLQVDVPVSVRAPAQPPVGAEKAASAS